MTGLYYSNYTGSTSVLRGATFGRIAGTDAAILAARRPEMRIWHQSFTVLDDVPHYRDALARHLAAQADPGTTIDLHGMAPGTYPSDYPGTHIGYAYLAGLHREQFVQAALRAQDEGYDAFLIATIPDTGFEEVRTLVDIPVVAFGQTSVLMAAQLGDCVGIVNFIEALVPQLRRNLRNYRLDQLVGPIVQVEAGFTDVMAAYADPRPLLDAFTVAARRAIAERCDGDRARRRAAQRVPRRPGRGAGRRRPRPRLARHVRPAWPSCAPRSTAPPGCAPRRVGFYGAQPTRAARRCGAVVLRRAGVPGMSPADDAVDVAVAGGGAAGLMTALRASLDEDLVVAVFEKSTREGCNAADLERLAGGRRHPLPARGRHRGLAAAARRRHPGGQRRRGVATGRRGAVRGRAGGRGVDRRHRATRSRSAPTCPAPGCRSRACTPTSAGSAARRLVRHLRDLLDDRPNVAFVDEAPAVGLLGVRGGRRRAGRRAERRPRGGRRARRPCWPWTGSRPIRALMDEHLAHLGRPFHGGTSTNTGDAIAWLAGLGAQLRNMGAALRSGLVVVGHGTRVSPALQFNGAVLLDTAGLALRGRGGARLLVDGGHPPAAARRTGRDGVGRDRDGGDPGVGDDARVARGGRDRDAPDAGRPRRRSSGSPPRRLRQSLAPRAGRRRLEAPYHLAWVTHGVLTTQGGVVIDPGGRVLDASGDPIPGLYAAGGTACGLAGPSSDGYSSGNGLLSAFGMGWIIGNSLAGHRGG